MLAFSTCWNSHRHTDGEIMLAEIRDLGFDGVELAPALPVGLLPGIRRLIDRGRIEITSLRSFCPAPPTAVFGPLEKLNPAAEDTDIQQKVRRLTRHTIDLATDLGASTVILELGTISSLKGLTASLAKHVSEGKIYSSAWAREKVEAVRKREEIAATWMDHARQMIDDALEISTAKSLRLAVTTAGLWEGLPDESEVLALLEAYPDREHFGYWHDFGHAARRSNLGFLNHADWLSTMKPHVVGAHIHDVDWPTRDQRVPFSGGVDFSNLVPLLPPDIPLVWEIHSSRKATDIRQALPSWKEQFKSVRTPA